MNNIFRYSPEAFEEFLEDIPEEEPQQERESVGPGVGKVDLLPFATKQLIKFGVEKRSRSEGTASVVATMIKAGFTEDEIISTFEREAIGEKAREKGSGWVQWLKDEIQRSREFVGTKNNQSFNEKDELNEFNMIENRIWQQWPELEKEALSGLAGRFVELASRNSEADPAAILLTFLARFGVEVGSRVFLYVGDTKHYARIIVVVV
jgi:hypothetical protein